MAKIKLLALEAKACFDYFNSNSNQDYNSPAFGLTLDSYPCYRGISSIAATGFALVAYIIGCERGWLDRGTLIRRVRGTLDSLLYRADHTKGFFYHFMDIKTGKRYKKSELSIIDTAIALAGAITAGEYFGGEIKEKAASLFNRVDWTWFRDKKNNRFYMGYTPEQGFSGWWDFYAEQLLMYILGAGSMTYPVPGDMFYSFVRYKRAKSLDFIYSWFGSLFTHQYSHAFIDFRGRLDRYGVDWFDNSVRASLANRDYCIELGRKFKTLHERSWGLTPCQGPFGYQGRYGAGPSGIYDDEHIVDGTVPPSGALGSIVFTPDLSLEALNYYKGQTRLWGEYGLVDAYNLDIKQAWYADSYIGINKGITLLMAENYTSGLVWELFMKNEIVQRGLKVVGLSEDIKRHTA